MGQRVIVLTAFVLIALFAVIETFGVKGFGPGKISTGSSYTEAFSENTAPHLPFDVTCLDSNTGSHSSSSHCMALLTAIVPTDTSGREIRFLQSPGDSLMAKGDKPPHGPPKTLALS